MAIILKNAPKTEEGRKLNLSKEEEYGADISVLQHQPAYYARLVA